jgi:hypothetical protein
MIRDSTPPSKDTIWQTGLKRKILVNLPWCLQESHIIDRNKHWLKSDGTEDVYRVFHPATAQYTFFSVGHGTFSKIDHILGHKANLNRCKKIEIIPYILSDHNAVKLELNNKSSSRKYLNSRRLSNTLLNDQWVIEEIRRNSRSSWNAMKMKAQPIRSYGTQKRQS